MKKSNKILLISLLSIAIEFLFFTILLVIAALLLTNIFAQTSKLYFWLSRLFIVFLVIYLVFSNTRYKSISSLVLGYSFTSSRFSSIGIIISNIFYYGIVFGFTWCQLEGYSNIYFQILRIIVLIEFATCFIPCIGTRLSMFVLGISYEFREKKTLPNDGVIL